MVEAKPTSGVGLCALQLENCGCMQARLFCDC